MPPSTQDASPRRLPCERSACHFRRITSLIMRREIRGLGIWLLRAKALEVRRPGSGVLYAALSGFRPQKWGTETALTMTEMIGHVAETVGHDEPKTEPVTMDRNPRSRCRNHRSRWAETRSHLVYTNCAAALGCHHRQRLPPLAPRLWAASPDLHLPWLSHPVGTVCFWHIGARLR
jgi:hypothetical protein